MALKVDERFRKWQVWEQAGVIQKTNGPFSDAFSVDSMPLLDGLYRISWSFELNVLNGGQGSDPIVRVSINQNIKANFAYTSASTNWNTFSSWDFQNYSDGQTPTIAIEIRRPSGTDTAQIRRIKVSLELMKSGVLVTQGLNVSGSRRGGA